MKMTLKPILAAALTGLLGLTALSASAAQLIVEKNHTARIGLSAPAGSVIVGNPDIADVNVVDSHTVYIVGKGFGNSTVTITGRDGRALYDADVVVTAAQKGAITVYKGLKPSLMVCSNICIDEQPDASNTGGSNGSAPGVAPAVMSLGPTVSQGAGAVGNTIGAAGGATAMVVQ